MAVCNLEELAQRGKKYFASTKDDKCFVKEEEMKVLLADPGAAVKSLNVPHCDTRYPYLTEVVYRGMRFVTVTEEEIVFETVVSLTTAPLN